NELAKHLADNDQLTLAMVEIVRDKAKSVLGDAAKVVDSDGNEVDLKAIYTEINGAPVEEEAEEAPAEEKTEA
ncbi:MAG: trigger factor, partial [Nonomuraea sp.]|nr:trigger factor [Nonomuraea sp.]